MNIKMNNLLKSVIFASFISIIFRLIMIQYPLYNSRAKIYIKKNIYLELPQIDCVGISTKVYEDSSGKEFIFTSKSYSKKYNENCINKGIDHIEEGIEKLNKRIIKRRNDYNIILNDYDQNIKKIESQKVINRELLEKIERYILISQRLRTAKANLIEPNEFNRNITIQHSPNAFENINRYMISIFLLSFWLIYVVLEEFNNEK